MAALTRKLNYEWKSIAFAITAIVLASVQTSLCSVSESDFIPFWESDGNFRFRFGDDNSRGVSFVRSYFKFFNNTYSSTHVSGNGLISFGQAHASSSVGSECQVTDIPLVMAFWADANEGVTADPTLTYMETTNPLHLAKITRDVRSAFPQHRTISLTWLFVVTWRNVGSHKATSDSNFRNKRNTFQLVLATDGISSFVLLSYNRLEWSNGNGIAGFDYGRSRRRYKLPGSCTNSILDIATTSNVNVPGKWIFQVDSYVMEPSLEPLLSSAVVPCNKSNPTLQSDPLVVSVMGNIPLFIHGLCVEENANVSCTYLDKGQSRPSVTKGVFLSKTLICPVPFLYSLGKMDINILITNPNQSPTIHTLSIFVVKEHEFSSLPLIFANKTENSLLLSAQWEPSLLAMSAIREADNSNASSSRTGGVTDKNCQILSETVQVVLLEYDGKKWANRGPITPPLLNNGIHMSPLNRTLFNSLMQRKKKILLRTLAIEAKYTLKTGEDINKLYPTSSLVGTDNLIHLTVDLDNATANTVFFDKVCQSWYDKEPTAQLDTLLCPNIIEQARLDWRFSLSEDPHTALLNELASSVYIQNVASPSGQAAQCAYDKNGRLLHWMPSCGRVFRRSPNSVTGYWRHYLEDLLPYMYCCKWGSTRTTWDKCGQYFEKRPVEFGTNYVAPRPLRIVGDPHITTFDGLSYTFNGAGEYWMVKYSEDSNDHFYKNFNMQVRMEPFSSLGEDYSNASVITAAVMEEINHEYEVKVQVALNNNSDQGLSVFVDGEPLNVYYKHTNPTEEALPQNDSPWSFQNQFTLYHVGVTIILKPSNETVISFASGFSFNFKAVDGALNIVGSAAGTIKNKTVGLLGNYDDLPSNDFKLPNGTLLDTNSTMKYIHNNFGMQWLVQKKDTIFMYPSGKSYSDFYHPTFEPLNVLLDEDNHLEPDLNDDVSFCEDFKDCIFDYIVTGSSSIAMGTKGYSSLYEEIFDISKKVVEQCDHLVPPELGYFEGTSYVVGSSVILHCDSENTKTETTFTCTYRNGNEMTTPTWVNLSGGANHSNPSCESAKYKNRAISTNAETMKQEMNSETEPSSQSSSVTAWVFILFVVIFAVISVVGIVKYPPCRPVKHFFTNKYYEYRSRARSFDNDMLNLSFT